MKSLLLIACLAAAFCSTGCIGTPGYSPSERDQLIWRNWNYEGGQMVDDFDHLMLLRPARGDMTVATPGMNFPMTMVIWRRPPREVSVLRTQTMGSSENLQSSRTTLCP